jgi:hypothetical protein
MQKPSYIYFHGSRGSIHPLPVNLTPIDGAFAERSSLFCPAGSRHVLEWAMEKTLAKFRTFERAEKADRDFYKSSPRKSVSTSFSI